MDVAGDELRRDAPSFEEGRDPGVVEERREAELTARGAAVADAERPSTGTDAVGVADDEGFAAGLSQEEKKSSSSPPAGAEAAAGASVIPSTKMRAGYLRPEQRKFRFE